MDNFNDPRFGFLNPEFLKIMEESSEENQKEALDFLQYWNVNGGREKEQEEYEEWFNDQQFRDQQEFEDKQDFAAAKIQKVVRKFLNKKIK